MPPGRCRGRCEWRSEGSSLECMASSRGITVGASQCRRYAAGRGSAAAAPLHSGLERRGLGPEPPLHSRPDSGSSSTTALHTPPADAARPRAAPAASEEAGPAATAVVPWGHRSTEPQAAAGPGAGNASGSASHLLTATAGALASSVAPAGLLLMSHSWSGAWPRHTSCWWRRSTRRAACGRAASPTV